MDKTPEGLQKKLNIINDLGERIGMPLNPRKCHTLHMAMRTAKPTQFFIGNHPTNVMQEGDYIEYLGKPVGFQIIAPTARLEKYREKGMEILTSKLAPWQKLDAMKIFIYPSMTYAMRMGIYQKNQWDELDDEFKRQIRKVLSLPESSSLEYMYGSASAGALAIPIAAEESDIFRLDSAFKLLSSKDPIVQEMAQQDLCVTAREATRRPVTNTTACEWLNCDETANFARAENAGTIWTNVRGAGRRLDKAVKWDVNEKNEFVLKTDAVTLEPKHKQMTAMSIRKVMRKRRDEKLQEKPCQGKAMKLVSKSKSSTHFIRSGTYTRFVD
jgi:hypothetical protein